MSVLVRSSGRNSSASFSPAACAATAWPPASSISPTNTRAPSRASSSAVALPIPEAPPVTMTARSCISIAGSLLPVRASANVRRCRPALSIAQRRTTGSPHPPGAARRAPPLPQCGRGLSATVELPLHRGGEGRGEGTPRRQTRYILRASGGASSCCSSGWRGGRVPGPRPDAAPRAGRRGWHWRSRS